MVPAPSRRSIDSRARARATFVHHSPSRSGREPSRPRPLARLRDASDSKTCARSRPARASKRRARRRARRVARPRARLEGRMIIHQSWRTPRARCGSRARCAGRCSASCARTKKCRKSDDSPVTVADFAAQAVVSHVLGVARPDVGLVAEEDARRHAGTSGREIASESDGGGERCARGRGRAQS